MQQASCGDDWRTARKWPIDIDGIPIKPSYIYIYHRSSYRRELRRPFANHDLNNRSRSWIANLFAENDEPFFSIGKVAVGRRAATKATHPNSAPAQTFRLLSKSALPLPCSNSRGPRLGYDMTVISWIYCFVAYCHWRLVNDTADCRQNRSQFQNKCKKTIYLEADCQSSSFPSLL